MKKAQFLRLIDNNPVKATKTYPRPKRKIINQKAIAASLGHSKSIITFDVYTDKQALIEGGVEEIDAFIDEVHPYDSEDIQILKEKYGKKVLHRLA